MKLAFGGRSCRNLRLFELGQLDRGAGFDLVQNTFQRPVVGGLGPICQWSINPQMPQFANRPTNHQISNYQISNCWSLNGLLNRQEQI